jgi:hypothetical protein
MNELVLDERHEPPALRFGSAALSSTPIERWITRVFLQHPRRPLAVYEIGLKIINLGGPRYKNSSLMSGISLLRGRIRSASGNPYALIESVENEGYRLNQGEEVSQSGRIVAQGIGGKELPARVKKARQRPRPGPATGCPRSRRGRDRWLKRQQWRHAAE